MINEEPAAYSLALVLQRLLRRLERDGMLTQDETAWLLDEVIQELREQREKDVMTPTAFADASKAIGALYLPVRRQPPIYRPAISYAPREPVAGRGGACHRRGPGAHRGRCRRRIPQRAAASAGEAGEAADRP